MSGTLRALVIGISAWIAVLAMSLHSRGEEDLRRALSSLAAAACPWDRAFEGLEIRYTTRKTLVDRSRPPQTESFVYSQAGPRLWRLDLTLSDGQRASVCGYDDLCYTVFDGQYRRVGFESPVHSSVEGTLMARNPLMSEATSILGEPLADMLRIPSFVFEVIEDPQHEGSTRRAVWRHDGAKNEIPPAAGVIEWCEEKIGALITHLEYRRKTGESTAPSVIVVDVEYRDWDGRLLPSRSIRKNAAVIEETILEAVAPAVADRAHYSPEAFGLAVPRRPWNRWQISGVILALAALIVVAWRWFSNR